MPRPEKPGRASASAPETPSSLLRGAETALETGERRQRNGEDSKAVAYFQTVCSTLADMREDRKACLLWATAMANLVELRAPSWSGFSTANDVPALELAASALERGHAAAIAAGALSEERAHLLSARAECAGLIRERLSDDWTAAAPWAAEAAKLWEQSINEELAAQSASNCEHAPEASVESLCSLGFASMAFGKLVLTCGAEKLEAVARRAAQAAVKRALDAFEEACQLCDTAYGLTGLEPLCSLPVLLAVSRPRHASFDYLLSQ